MPDLYNSLSVTGCLLVTENKLEFLHKICVTVFQKANKYLIFCLSLLFSYEEISVSLKTM